MELKEKVRRIEEVVNLNHDCIKQIARIMKMLCKEVDLNVGDIHKITKVLSDEVGMDIETGEAKKTIKVPEKEITRFYA